MVLHEGLTANPTIVRGIDGRPRPSEEQLIRTKEYIDDRARNEWRELYGEVHEEYVTIQSQVYIDEDGDVTIIMPRYNPPGTASSSTTPAAKKIPITASKPESLPTDYFHSNLTQAIRAEALRRAVDIEKEFDAQLWYLFHMAVAKGKDPAQKKLGHTPASLYGSSKKTYHLAKDVFKDRIKAMWDPQHFKYGIWGFSEVQVDIVRGIIFVRYITGWWERDKKDLAEKKLSADRLAKRRGELDSARAPIPRQDVDTLHDDLDA